MVMSAEHTSKFAAIHRQWWSLHMSEKFSSGTINHKQTNWWPKVSKSNIHSDHNSNPSDNNPVIVPLYTSNSYFLTSYYKQKYGLKHITSTAEIRKKQVFLLLISYIYIYIR